MVSLQQTATAYVAMVNPWDIVPEQVNERRGDKFLCVDFHELRCRVSPSIRIKKHSVVYSIYFMAFINAILEVLLRGVFRHIPPATLDAQRQKSTKQGDNH